MGSNVSKGRQPGGPAQRKSALKKRHGPYGPARNHTTGDPFGTELFHPETEIQPDTSGPQTERSYPSPRSEMPTERTIPRVHYEDEPDAPVYRDGMVLSDTDRPNRSVNPRPRDRPWHDEDTYPDYSPRQYRPRMPNHYMPRPIARRPYRQPGRYSYPYRSLPPSIYPYRPRRPRPFVPYNEMYRSPVPVDERYRPAPVMYHSPRAVPVPVPINERPPPYHALETMTYRGDYVRDPREQPLEPPYEQPVPTQADEKLLTIQDGEVTERSVAHHETGDYSNRDKQVVSLLSPEHLAKVKHGPENPKPKSQESVHERDDDEYIGANLKFYRNQLKFRPNGETIDYVHKYWYGNYSLLEKHHTYIQWLFPLYDISRVNPDAVPLRAHEAKHIYEDPETRNRFLTSFLLMLDFYGFSMADEQTGKIERAANWKERFNNLNRSGHDHFRITRILKSLGELGQSKLQTTLVMALFHEVFETQELSGIPPASLYHWLHSIKDDFERQYVYKQFKKGLTRLEEERETMKRKDDTKYYFERRNKPFNESYRQLQLTKRMKPGI